MHNATAPRSLEGLIDAHTNFGQATAGQLAVIAHHLDVDTSRRYARQRQDRFDATGLPRGLARVV